MKATLIKIGNSRGIRIPKVLIEEAGLDNELELKLKNGKLFIEPVPKKSKSSVPKRSNKPEVNYEYLVSYGALADWNRPEEDEAWAYLQ